jgi:hypothetical protein
MEAEHPPLEDWHDLRAVVRCQGRLRAPGVSFWICEQRSIPVRWKADPVETRYRGAVDVKPAAKLLARGMSLREVATQLDTAPDTIRDSFDKRAPLFDRLVYQTPLPPVYAHVAGARSSQMPSPSGRPSAYAAPSFVICSAGRYGPRSPQRGAPPTAWLPADKRPSFASDRPDSTAQGALA